MPITRQDVNDDIVAKISGKTTARSINPIDDGANRELMMDYVDQQAPNKSSSAVALTGTQSELPKDINFCNFTGGKAYLPSTTIIGKEILVLAVSNNIEIFANVANTSKMFATYGTFVASIMLTANQFYRFIYIGGGTGAGGTVDGYWKAEII